ncbi:hypothetical protein BDV12DRAFT_96061 [Aspergillus spectabilis]
MDPIQTTDKISPTMTMFNEAQPLDKQDSPRDIDPLSASETLSKRLTRLAHLSTLSAQTHPLTLDARSIHQCLDTLESLLDPRSHLTREITLCRPDAGIDGKASRKLDNPKQPNISLSSAHSRSRSLKVTPTKRTAPIRSSLAAIHDEVKTLADEFMKRRDETVHIYELYDQDRNRLRNRIAELEAEIEDLRADMQEDMAEREALQGTVRGFEAWIDGWLTEYDLAHLKKPIETPRRPSRGWWTKKKVDKPGGFDADALLEGITAWMRGWTDVEEEFRNRDRARRLRRGGRGQDRIIAMVQGL